MGNWVLFAIGVLLFGFGFLIFWGSLKIKKSADGIDENIEYKDGVPVLPRAKRNFDNVSSGHPSLVQGDTQADGVVSNVGLVSEVPKEEIHAADALSGLAKAVADANQAHHKHDEESDLTVELDDVSEVIELEIDDGFDILQSNETQKDDLLTVNKTSEVVTDEKQEGDNSLKTAKSELNFDNRVESDFTQNSPVLDEHFVRRAENDRNNEALLNHKRTVTMVLSPQNPFDEITGLKVLEVTHAYGMKYGIMNMFHRYERDNGTGDLWFSMLGVGHDGVRPFDLNTLPDSKFRGLALFVPLPHPDSHRAFSSMVSVAQMMMVDLNARLHDEAGNILSATDIQAIKNTLDD